MSTKSKNPGLTKSMKKLEKAVGKVMDDISSGKLTGSTTKLYLQALEVGIKFEAVKGRQMQKRRAGAMFADIAPDEPDKESADERREPDGGTGDQGRLN